MTPVLIKSGKSNGSNHTLTRYCLQCHVLAINHVFAAVWNKIWSTCNINIEVSLLYLKGQFSWIKFDQSINPFSQNGPNEGKLEEDQTVRTLSHFVANMSG